MKIVVLGGGESGYGSAVLAKVKGLEVFLSDIGQIELKYSSILDQYGIEYEQGKHTEAKILDADLVVKSPGIPDTAPIVVKLREKGIHVISEIEFGFRYTKGRIIGITGSNGKTTTTTIIGEMLKADGFDVAVCGNIGESFAYTVATDDKKWYVIELSSFQLDGIETFRPDIAVILNIVPDHLDRYEYKFQNYINSKFRILKNIRPNDYFIGCIDCVVIAREVILRNPNVKRLPFSVNNHGEQDDYNNQTNTGHNPELTIRHTNPDISVLGGEDTKLDDVNGHTYPGAFLINEKQFRATVDERSLTIDTTKMKIKGLHNTYNAMCATLAALAADVNTEAIENVLYTFEGIEHRMENTGTVDGVKYINDSKATNVASTFFALECMKSPTIWIAGGTDKGNNYSMLKESVRKNVKALICLGIDNTKLFNDFADLVPVIYDTKSMEEAMQICASIAQNSDTVLLSPACASFDLFKNYEDRGKQFKQAVEKLKASK